MAVFSWKRCAVDGMDGRTWARVAARVRKGELGLWPLGSLGQPRRLAAPAGPSASPAGSVRRAAGQHGRARARERGGRAQAPRGGSRTGSQPGRLRHPDPQPGGSAGPSPASARDGRPAPRPHPGPVPGERRDGRAPALPDRGSGGTTTASAPGWRNGTSRPSFRPGADACTPSPTTRNRTRRARPWNGASAGSNKGAAWPPATTNTRSGSWVFCT